MSVHDIAFAVCSIGAALLVVYASSRLRMNEPLVRIGTGLASIVLAGLVFLAMIELLPRPQGGEWSTSMDMAVVAASGLSAGLLVLSVMEILGGLFHAFKRWLQDRRNAG